MSSTSCGITRALQWVDLEQDINLSNNSLPRVASSQWWEASTRIQSVALALLEWVEWTNLVVILNSSPNNLDLEVCLMLVSISSSNSNLLRIQDSPFLTFYSSNNNPNLVWWVATTVNNSSSNFQVGLVLWSDTTQLILIGYDSFTQLSNKKLS